MAGRAAADDRMVPGGLSDSALRARFTALWVRLGANADVDPIFDSVLQGWKEPHRRYHGLDHLGDCLARLDESPAAGKDRDLAEAALWYHDLVYQPGAADNEARSAARARADLAGSGAPEPVAEEVARLVQLTDHAVPPVDPLAALVCDVDLSILGRSAEEFEEYEQRIREEYREVPDSLWRSGRARVLTNLLSRDPLFRTGHFQRHYETSARRNLRHSLELLSRSPGA
jgi:predicted metal-dependent HD superfamily phosphohydrolase